MATTFTRTLYDKAEHEMYDSSVKNTNEWIMDSNLQENNSACFANDGARHGESELARPLNEDGKLNISEKVNVESLLQNRHLDNNSFKRTNKDYAEVKLNTPSVCGNMKENMNNADTRFTHPLINYRGMYTAPYNFTPYLHMNPQDVLIQNDDVMSPNRFGTSTRIEAKSNNKKNKNKETDFSSIVSGLLPKKA